jgi:hypothetical protein
MIASAPLTAAAPPTAVAGSSSTFGKETSAKETASVITLPQEQYLAMTPNRESVALALQDVAKEKLKTDIVRADAINQVEEILKAIVLENLALQAKLNKKNIEVVQLQEKEKAEEAKLLAIIAQSEANIKLWEANLKAFIDVNAGNKQTIQQYSTMNATLTSQANECCTNKSYPVEKELYDPIMMSFNSNVMYCPIHKVHYPNTLR